LFVYWADVPAESYKLPSHRQCVAVGRNFNQHYMSKTARGARRTVEVSVSAWIDLLGYGSMLREAQFDPTVELAQKAIQRLETFHKTAAKHAHRTFNIIAINDGLICHKDISPRASSKTADFLKRVINLHRDINTVDIKDGYCGARAIVATGFRVRALKRITVESSIKEVLLKKLENNEISSTEAINMAVKSRSYFGIIPEIQANFAFTKAYLIDSEGSNGGFAGPNCFIDLSMFNNPLPKYITFSNYINWNNNGLWGKFGQLKSFDFVKAGEEKDKGFLNAFEIAENITKSPDAEKRIRAITKKKWSERER